ncbi:hypothetical protein F5B20DRAFT_583762 [Whalleya microplaca]|nr:hypothetical protein F5B20DRAFT_583762 [Whalleya microplaca]
MGQRADIAWVLRYAPLQYKDMRSLNFVNALYKQPHEAIGGFLDFHAWNQLLKSLVNNATALEVLIIDWQPLEDEDAEEQNDDGYTRRYQEIEERELRHMHKFLETLIKFDRLRVLILRGSYFKWWADMLRERMTGTRIRRQVNLTAQCLMELNNLLHLLPVAYTAAVLFYKGDAGASINPSGLIGHHPSPDERAADRCISRGNPTLPSRVCNSDANTKRLPKPMPSELGKGSLRG